MSIGRILAIAAAFLLTGAAPFAPPADKSPTVYRHATLIDGTGAPAKPDMVERGTVLDATLHVYREVEAAAKEQRKPPLCTVALAAKLTNQAYRAGVTISAGTDGDTDAGDPWPALFDELELLNHSAGLPPSAVVKAATLNGAKAAGQEQEMGTIAVGKLANLVVLTANPLEDVKNFRTVVLTVKRGRAFQRGAQPAR